MESCHQRGRLVRAWVRTQIQWHDAPGKISYSSRAKKILHKLLALQVLLHKRDRECTILYSKEVISLQKVDDVIAPRPLSNFALAYHHIITHTKTRACELLAKATIVWYVWRDCMLMSVIIVMLFSAVKFWKVYFEGKDDDGNGGSKHHGSGSPAVSLARGTHGPSVITPAIQPLNLKGENKTQHYYSTFMGSIEWCIRTQSSRVLLADPLQEVSDRDWSGLSLRENMAFCWSGGATTASSC